jgi:gamma-glutamyltranspeptidase/glutathione hydrolase
MNWEFPYSSHRKPVLAANCVATTQPLAAQAGLSMLARGGGAVDAAIATAVALTVVEPTANGIGADAFAIVWDGAKLAGLNASGRAPAGWTRDRFSGPYMPHEGWDSVTVPGAVSAWVALHERFGRLPFATLFEPAIRYARDGFMVSPVVALQWARQVERLRDQPGFAETFLPCGRAPMAGELFRSPAHGETLRQIAETGGEAFYRGALAEAIEHAARSDGGAMTAQDLAAHSCEWVEPIAVEFRGHTIHELPPNGQGIAALVAFGILERLDLAALDPDGPEMLHLQIEAAKIGMADVATHVAEPEFMVIDVAELLDPVRLDKHANSIRRDHIAAPAPKPQHDGGTVYLAAADSTGMMVSYIQSNYDGFGSGVVVPNTGIALNNRGACFIATPGHPNSVAPNKRPLNTIIPGFITKAGAPAAAFGVMGGTMQPQGHVQVVSRMLVSEQNPQAAIDAPRWRIKSDELWVEPSIQTKTLQGLAARGYRIIEGTFLDFGAAQVVSRMDHGYLAASESRRDGCAVGF